MKKSGIMKRLTFLFAVCLLFAGCIRVQAAEGLNVEYHSQDEIRQKAESLGIQKGMRDEYDVAPVGTAPYEAGKLNSASTNNGLNTLNLVRYIAGIPCDVQINNSYQEMAQAATLLNWANNQMDHYPTKPAGIDDSLYQLGYQGAKSSNLAWAWSSSSSVSYNLYQAICDGWMDDSDDYNIKCLGHRRWCLDPGMKYTGFGAAGDSDKGYYHAMYSIDGASRSTAYSGIAWPAQNMPVDMFRNGSLAWSFSAGKILTPSNVKVTLTKESTGQVWNFSSGSSDGYFNVDNEYYGLPGCIVFRPSGIGSYNENDVFHVEITGTGAPVSYDVRFFNMNKQHTHTGGTATCSKRAVCVSCGQEYGEYKDHEFELVESKEATCTEMGVKTYRCKVCKTAEQQEMTSALGHIWGSGEITTKPTCTTKGLRTFTCSRCGKSRTEEIEAENHKWNTTETIDKEATCKEPGKKSIHCSVCDAIKEGSEKTIKASDHKWDEGKVVMKSTCSEHGEKLYRCTVCQEEKTEELPLTDHHWDERYEIPPTCTSDGKIDIRCTTCLDQIVEVIPKTGHNWGAWETLEEPSYYTEGREERICKNCGENEYRSIPKLKVTGVKNPKLASVKAVSYNSIQIKWNAVKDATGYRIYRKESGGSWKTLKTVSVKTLSWKDTSVVTGTTYTYRVRAYLDVSGNRTWSKYSAGISAATALSKPSAPALKTSSSHKTTVSWKKVSGASKYEIYCKTGSSGKYVKIGTTSKNSFVHKGCKKGTTYTYKIRALRKVSSKPEKYVKSAYGPTAKIKSK